MAQNYSQEVEQRKEGRQDDHEEQERRGTKRSRTRATEEARGRDRNNGSGYSDKAIQELSRLDPARATETVCREIKKFINTLNDKHSPDFIDAVLGIIYKVTTEIQHPESYASGDARRVLAEVLSSRCAPFREQLAQHISSSQHIATIEHVCCIFKGIVTTLPDYARSLPIKELKEAALSWGDELLCQQVNEMEELSNACVPVSSLLKSDFQSSAADDYRRLPLIPTLKEISCNRRPTNLQANIIQGPYENWSHYYEVHFRLLREEFLAPLRRGVSCYREGKRGRDLSDVTVYNSVQIIGTKLLLSGICYKVRFDNSRFRRSGWEHSKRLLTGSLICLSPDEFNSIVLFATVAERLNTDLQRGLLTVRFESDVEMHHILNLKTTFVMVESKAFFEASKHTMSSLQLAETETMPFTKYIIKAKCASVKPPMYLNNETCIYDLSCIYASIPEAVIHPTRPEVEALVSKSDMAFGEATSVSGEDPSTALHPSVAFNDVCSTTEDGACSTSEDGTYEDGACSTSEDGTYEDGECSTSEDACSTPEDEVCPPGPEDGICSTSEYGIRSTFQGWPLSNSDVCLKTCFPFNACAPISKHSTSPDAQAQCRFDILDPLQWPKEGAVQMDQSQIDALKLALTQEVAVIQGPPGTGKTFVGLKIVEVLLNNKHQWDPEDHSPILVICFTNHALDQFLEGILNIKLKRKRSFQPIIARVGGRCQSEKVNAFNVEKWCVGNYSLKNFRSELGDNQRELQDKISDIQGYIDWPSTHRLLTLSQLKGIANPDHIYQLAQVSRNKRERGHELEIWLELLNETQPSSQDKHAAGSAGNCHPEASMRCGGSASDQKNESAATSGQSMDVRSEVDDEASQRFLTGDEDCIDSNESEDNSKIETEGVTRAVEVESLHSKIHSDVASMERRQYNNASLLLKMPLEKRRKLYDSWVLKYHRHRIESKQLELNTFSSKCKELQTKRSQLHCSVLENKDVIGMTTTGAAKYQHIIHQIKPKIVIVEEAAEVLEAHIVSELTSGTQHLILIGDHKQLRPKLNEYELVTKYNFDISLFERLINNKLAHATLNIQHRMRPEIADLVHPHIYPTLHNHSSVLHYNSVKGVAKNMFFITHEYPEECNSDTISYANCHEAEFIASLCKYVLQQGYTSNQITILTPYTGQLLALRKFMPKDTFSGVRVTAVDNFQGEENDIILLSLVRSNAEKNPGFLKEMNRVCVALSRAKQGFYCIGNFKMLRQRVKLFDDIVSDVDSKGCLGEGISLYCQIHQEKAFVAKLPQDFVNNAPEGGCMQNCAYGLNCGHICQKKCHIDDRQHTNYKCKERCERKCPNSHPCKKYCFEDCGKCDVIVEKQMTLCYHTTKLPCHVDPSSVPCDAPCLKPCSLNHSCQLPCYKPSRCEIVVKKKMPTCAHQQDIPCHMNPAEYKCQAYVTKEIPRCRHEQRMLCSDDPSTFPCEESCATPMPCGHKCPSRCKDPCPKICREIVDEVQLNCNHTYKIECHEKQSNCEILCLQKCTKTLACGHPCAAKCYVPCSSAQCMTVVTKKLPCGRTLMRECYKFQAPDMYPCDKECLKKLICGHQCPAKCGEACNPAQCTKVCSQMLLCGHVCPGICGECYSTRMHQACWADIKMTPFCGHTTFTACRGLEHQCKKEYIYSCPHEKYKLKCPVQLPRCSKPCVWKCPHHKCYKLCYEQCDRGPCGIQCPLPLKCGHQCSSLCGEPCLRACPKCQDLAFRRSLRGIEAKNGKLPPKQLYIQLQPCGHIFTVGYLDNFMKRKLDMICPKQCPDPNCNVSICCGYRYGNAAKAALADFAMVSKKIATNHMKYRTMENQVVTKLDTCRENCTGVLWLYWELVNVVPDKYQPTLDMLQFFRLVLTGLDLITYLSEIEPELTSEFSKVCSNFIRLCKTPNTQRILLSDQLEKDFTSEVFRIFLATLLHKASRSHTSSSDRRMELVIKRTEDYLKALDLDHFQRISHQDFEKHRRDICKLLNPFHAPEIDLGKEAVMNTRCQWMKCSQGHYYTCPPMVKSPSCPECHSREHSELMEY